jgi:hypothetical protein
MVSVQPVRLASLGAPCFRTVFAMPFTWIDSSSSKASPCVPLLKPLQLCRTTSIDVVVCSPDNVFLRLEIAQDTKVRLAHQARATATVRDNHQRDPRSKAAAAAAT